jgi:hypothetical protein
LDESCVYIYIYIYIYMYMYNFGGETSEKRSLGIPGHRFADAIALYLKEMGGCGQDSSRSC